MIPNCKFVHVNLIARDWEKLAGFYETVFGCVRLQPQRDLSGHWLDEATRLQGARIRGVHLRLPGYAWAGPTLEIFQYDENAPTMERVPNKPGFAHIAFSVEDVELACRTVEEAGGRQFGQAVTLEVPGAGHVTFVYVADPEGNLIELQNWKTA